jgi:two-component sensor histidine kinase
MTLNELCTNTTKFGALSVPEGRVDITWTLDPQTQRLCLSWTEKNGPPVHPPERRSFGTRLIETLGKRLKGHVRLTYESTGFRVRIRGTNSFCDFVGDISWYSGIAGGIKMCRRFFQSARSHEGGCPAA